jgi:hypothetical protein
MNPQNDTYDLVLSAVFGTPEGESPKIIVEATRVGTKDVEIQRLPIQLNEERRAEWLQEVQSYIEESERRAFLYSQGHSEAECWPRNTKACHTQFGRCPFWEVCTSRASERPGILAQDFHYEPWDPIACDTVAPTEEETEE